MARVQFDHVYKRFNKVEIVHDINLDIKDKEFLVLVGPSGTLATSFFIISTRCGQGGGAGAPATGTKFRNSNASDVSTRPNARRAISMARQ